MQLQGATERERIAEMHPSFELVIDFVKNEAISVEKVQSLLQHRAKMASSVAQVYTLAAEYIRILSVPFVFEVGDHGWQGAVVRHLGVVPCSCPDSSSSNSCCQSRDIFQSMYRNLPINRPCALEIHGQNWMGVYTEMGAYSGECGNGTRRVWAVL